MLGGRFSKGNFFQCIKLQDGLADKSKTVARTDERGGRMSLRLTESQRICHNFKEERLQGCPFSAAMVVR